ncbi:MAG: hypothetical protein JWN01_60 [Patescibacteria group bacterium]|nr:hypothetical protein [Patescibacteria group bacterium]
MIERYDPELEAAEWTEGVPAVEAEAPRPRKAHWAAWTSSMVAVGAVLGLVIIGGLKFVSDPVEANGKSLSHEQASVAPTPFKPPTNQLGALTFTFSYPGEFDQVAQSKNSSRALEQYMLGSKANYRHSIAVEVNPLVAGGLSGDSSYRTRQIHPADYRETQEQIGGDLVATMTKVDKQEQAMFWVHGDKVLTVAITSSDAKDDVAAFMALIKKSVRWH